MALSQVPQVDNAKTPPPVADIPSAEYLSPKRFEPPKSTLLIDRFMTQFIKVGGVSIITAVFAIFIFILWQILPLFQPAEVQQHSTIQLPKNQYLAMGIDEWGELPYLLQTDGRLLFVNLMQNGKYEFANPPFAEQKSISAVESNTESRGLIAGTKDGFFSIVSINYKPVFSGDRRQIAQETSASPFYQIGAKGAEIVQIDYGDDGTDKLVAAIQEVDGKRQVHAVTLTQSTGLLGPGEIEVGKSVLLSDKIQGNPQILAVNTQASDLVVATTEGEVFYFVEQDGQLSLRQAFTPFGDLNDVRIATIDFLLGGSSLVITGTDGANRVFSLYHHPGSETRSFGQTKEFDRLPGIPNLYAASLRNKAFLTATGSFASLRYATTEEVRWEENLPFQISRAVIGGKYDRILFLDAQNRLQIYRLKDPHPESSLKSLIGEVWYEGSSQPKYEWQSTGASDDFEPKLSLVPLIIGTLKGTFYAMLFAVPIALLAAIYTSQFLHPNFRVIVKPTMEIMASLPSVVLGFLAALWLAPVIETRVPSVLLIVLALPAAALSFGWFWARLPISIRVRVRPGYEWLVFIPILFVTAYAGWRLGPWIEQMFFVVTDPDTGTKVSDFRLWWPQVTGLPFEQRNSMVVGFMMGFAVIPIIFTITEDALSNVPPALTSGSLALGASRWQTAMRIVLPTASAGIFSAIMIGLGRAVGETMIVVMATGNTPIMDFNIFSGMRTLSANIAVELPEAPVNGTLYRTLFLGAMVLFILTFTVNTAAEIMRQHLREKYKTV